MLFYVRIKLGHFVAPGKTVFLVLPFDYLADYKMLNVMRVGKIDYAEAALPDIGNLFAFAKFFPARKNLKCTVKVYGVSVFYCKGRCHVCNGLTAVCAYRPVFALESADCLFVLLYLFGRNSLGRNKMPLLLGRVARISSVFIAGTVPPVVAPVF